MTITQSLNDKTCTLLVDGRIDTLTSAELEQAVNTNAPLCEKLVLDLAGVDYISSAGIRTVLNARKTVGGDNLTLRNLNRNVFEIFKMTGFTKVLNIE